MTTKHLDLGCGGIPRNPYNQNQVYGIDIKKRTETINSEAQISEANLSIDRIPFEDNTFDSVSAYDFIEHIPRVLYTNNTTTFPFVNLMTEIYRVLKKDGRLIALTPYYPKYNVFSDPTHVNIITKNTVKYFAEPDSWATMYGFRGKFEIIQNRSVNFSLITETRPRLKKIIKTIYISMRPKLKEHLLWELVAKKDIITDEKFQSTK